MADIIRNEQLIAAMSTIAEPTRLRILRLIAMKGELCGKEILPEFNITQPTLSHHMSVLEESGLVITRKDGRMIYYSVNKKTISALADLIMSINSAPSNITVEVVKQKKETKDNSIISQPKKPVVVSEEKPKKDKKKKKDKDKGEKKKKDKKKKK